MLDVLSWPPFFAPDCCRTVCQGATSAAYHPTSLCTPISWESAATIQPKEMWLPGRTVMLGGTYTRWRWQTEDSHHFYTWLVSVQRHLAVPLLETKCWVLDKIRKTILKVWLNQRRQFGHVSLQHIWVLGCSQGAKIGHNSLIQGQING